MPVKIIGALAIIASCSMLGFELSSQLIKRTRVLEGWQQALQRMQGLIEYSKMPLYEIYETLSGETGAVGEFFERLKKCRGKPTEQSWKKNLGEMRELTKKDREILQNLAEGLGKGDLATQIKDIEFARQGIEIALEGARTVSLRDAKMYRSISFFAGVTIAILLI